MPFRDAHELWTKLQDKYGVSKICGDDCSPSTSGRDAFSTSSTSPTCGFPQGNEMVSSLSHCNDDSELILDNPLSLSYCNASLLDLNTSSTINVLHAHEAKVSKLVPHVDIITTSTHYAILPCASPCNSSTHNVATSCDELLSLPCCSNNASTSSSTCI